MNALDYLFDVLDGFKDYESVYVPALRLRQVAAELAAMQAVVDAAIEAKKALEPYYKISNNGEGYMAAYNYLALPLRDLTALKGGQDG